MPVRTFDIDRDRRDIDVSPLISDLIPDDAPFTVILNKARKRATDTAEFVWFEQQPGSWATQINNAAGYTATDTNLVVDDAAVFASKDVVKVLRTGEVMFVTAVNTAANTITVVRGYGVTTAADLQNDDWLLRIGNAMEESSSAPSAKLRQPSKKRNYTQIFRTPFDASMTATVEKLKTRGSERDRLRKLKLLEHRMDIERALLFGEPKEDAANMRRMTGGLFYFITTNVYDAGGTLTETEFDQFAEMAFAYGRRIKYLISSPRVLTVINAFAENRLKTEVSEDTYGLRLARYITAHGDFILVPSRALEKDYAYTAVAVDLDNIYYRPLDGRDTTLRANIQANDVDGWMDEYLTEAGLEVRLEQTHAILRNVTA